MWLKNFNASMRTLVQSLRTTLKEVGMAGIHDPRALRAEKLPSQVASSESFGFSKRPCFSI